MTQIDSFGTLRFRWRLPTKNQPDHSRHLISCNSSLCFWLWRGGVSAPFIYLMYYFWLPLGISAFVDRHPSGGVHLFTWPLCPVYIFSRWFSGTSFFSAAHLARLCLGCVDGEKSPVVPRFSMHYTSVVGQDQAILFQVVEGDKCYFSL
jgi:hypothetical protein